ncbi:hypothetical protein MSPP1_001589 [Malassezia sp. CBS 17886]|nr:hypothetical protein MSPP1_001589 [Malassezia sp. CBS 17886]
MSHTTSRPNPGAHAADQEAVQTAIFKKLYPEDYLRRHLSENVREDGRAFDAARDVSVATGVTQNAFGSALVRLGSGTIVTAAVQGHVCEPHHERPTEGFVVPTVDMSPLCSPEFKPGPPSDEVQVVAHRLQMFLTESRFIPRTALCLVPGAAVWALYVDVVCVSADGCVLDAAALACVAALRQCTLPAHVAGTDARSCVFDASRRIPLATHGLPALLSSSVIDSTYLVADPTAFEESLASAALHIGIQLEGAGDRDMFSIMQLGSCMAHVRGERLANDALVEHCVAAARRRAEALVPLLQHATPSP